jgi:hypothetical protein
MKKGTCKLCQQVKDLNFEHIPPRSAGNKVTRYQKGSFLNFITSDSPLTYSPNAKVNQGGIGFYCYCENCNNFLGLEYVRSYKNWYGAGLTLVQDPEAKGLTFQVEKQSPLRTLKQVVSMFIAVNESESILNNKELINFISTPQSNNLPNNIRVFCYLNRGPKLRYIGLMAKGNLSSGSMVLSSEITFPPFGYVLILDSPKYKNELLTEITDFKNFKPDQEYTLDFKMNILETNLPILLDYRSNDEIEDQMKEN